MVTWEKLQIIIRFDPKTGSIKPWEMWAIFPEKRVHWGSFKTEEAANKDRIKTVAKYRAKYGEGVS